MRDNTVMTVFFTGFTVFWGLFLLQALRALRALRSLDDFAHLLASSTPRISIVVAVKDGEHEIGKTLKKLLEMRYQSLELIVVNDRSQDRTPEILNSLAATDPRLRVFHVSELPAGWLGKVHALHQGTKVASGEFVLFLDADMPVSDEILTRAALIMESERLDHLAVLPNVTQRGYFVDLLMATSVILFTTSTRPWLSIEKRPLASVKGVGAFNMVRKSSFEKTEGFQWLKMDVADDVALGQLMARDGGRSLFIRAGVKGPRIDWYLNLWEMILGLEKNSVGGFTNYRWSIFLLMTSASYLAFLVPLAALTEGVLQENFTHIVMGLAAVIFTVLFSFSAAPIIRYPLRVVMAFPAGIALLGLVLTRSFLICQKNGGIRWSGTLYPLSELKKGCRVRLGL